MIFERTPEVLQALLSSQSTSISPDQCHPIAGIRASYYCSQGFSLTLFRECISPTASYVQLFEFALLHPFSRCHLGLHKEWAPVLKRDALLHAGSLVERCINPVAHGPWVAVRALAACSSSFSFGSSSRWQDLANVFPPKLQRRSYKILESSIFPPSHPYEENGCDRSVNNKVFND